ncbi:MAG: DUF1015 domain-containing protein [Candidatus Aminicenantes bacterium]|nr:DUF1015 domain-containing protein [Candidatus Aminicenantes bacterium]
MAVLKKFKAWRPKKGLEKQVASYPYDVVSSEEARALAENNPYSFLHVVKPEIDLPSETDLYSQPVYNKAKENFEKFKREGTLVQEEEPKLYIYRQTMKGREQYGIVGCVSVDDYDKDIIRKHEHTRPAKEQDRIKHVDITNANAGPIFLTYKALDAINSCVEQTCKSDPVYDFVADDDIGHTVWIIEDESISDAIISEFAKIDYLYVADGHHRSASAARVANMRRNANPSHRGDEEYNFFLAVLFPDKQLQIMDYNRVLKHMNGRTEEELFAALKEIFTVEKKGANPYRPARKGEIGMYMDREWFNLTIKPGLIDHSDPVMSLDISILQKNLLAPFFGIDDPRTSDDIDFIGGIRGLEELVRLVDSGKFRVAFAMHPVSIHELMNIADAGKVMPPKTTWFEPKLRSGLLVHTLDD